MTMFLAVYDYLGCGIRPMGADSAVRDDPGAIECAVKEQRGLVRRPWVES